MEAGLTGNAVPEGIYHYSVSDLALTLGTMDMAGSGRDRGVKWIRGEFAP